MYYLQRLLKNFIKPNQTIMYRFQRLGGSIGYVFVLSVIITALFIPQVLSNAFWYNGQHLSYIFVPIIITFYYILFIGISFVGISLLASLGLLMKVLLDRKLNYQQVWILTTNAITIPSIVLAIIETIFPLPTLTISVYGLICFLILIHMIKRIPKSKIQKK